MTFFRGVLLFASVSALSWGGTVAKEEIKLGSCFGYFNQMGAYILMAKIALDEGYFDDILPANASSSAFTVSVAAQDTLCSTSTAYSVMLPLLLGQGTQDGRIYSSTMSMDPVVGIAGCTCSGASIAVSGMASNYKVPMVSASSTSPDLSNKALHPYFLRVVPPDSMQGLAFAALVKDFGWKRVLSVYTAEPYAQGIASALKHRLASTSDTMLIEYQFPFQPLGEPADAAVFDHEAWTDVALQVAQEAPQPRIFFGAGIQFDHVVRIFYDIGLVSNSTLWMLAEGLCNIQLLRKVGPVQSDYQAADPDDSWWDFPWMDIPLLLRGMLCLIPRSIGAKYHGSRFQDFFASVTKSKIENAGWLSERYGWDDAWLDPAFFSSIVYHPLAFDSLLPFVAAIGTLLAKGVDAASIKGDLLLAELSATDIEGITGPIGFDPNGDRLAPYNIFNMRVVDGAPSLEEIGAYDGIADSVSWTSQAVFADGTSNVPSDEPEPCQPGFQFGGTFEGCVACVPGRVSVTVNSRCVVCAPGYFQDSAGGSACEPSPKGAYVEGNGSATFVNCPSGWFTSDRGSTSCATCALGAFAAAEGMSECTKAGPGTFVESLGASEAVLCAPGHFSAIRGAQTCSPCLSGFFQDAAGQTTCERCEKGSYSLAASTHCQECGAGMTTESMASTSESDCRCPAGEFCLGAYPFCKCHACQEGMECPFGAEVEVLPGYQLARILPEGLSIYRCLDDPLQCPGGGLGACAEGRCGVACSLCKPGMTPAANGECEPCAGTDALPFMVLLLLVLGALVFIYYRVGNEDRAKQSHAVGIVVMSAAQVISVFQLCGVMSKLTVEWEDPVKSFVKALQVFNFDLELLRVQCVAHTSPLTLYIAKLAIVPAGVAFLIVIHFVVVLAVRRGQEPSALYGSTGVLVMAFFIAISTTVLSPFQCVEHPNGKWTILQFGSELCWETDTHTAMIVLGVVALSMPTGFIVTVYRLLWIFPQRMADGDVDFLNSFSFLFVRVKPERRWFMLGYLLRNLVIAFVPSIPSEFWQVVLMQAIFSGTLILTIALVPWRLPIMNALEIAVNYCLLGMMCLASFFVTVRDLQVVANVAVVVLAVILLFFPLGAMYGLYLRFVPREKPFRFFLCHHKAAAGAFSRLLKMALLERHVTKGTVFLDSDNLSDLDNLFHYVSQDTSALVVICSKEVLLRPWCLGEVTAAYVNQVRTLPIYFPDFVAPDAGFIQDVDSHVELTTLTENGLSKQQVQEALSQFSGLPRADVPCQLNRATLFDLTDAFAGRRESRVDASGTRGIRSQRSKVKSIASEGVCTVLHADTSNIEATSAALILQKLLTPMAQSANDIPELYEDLPRDFGSSTLSITKVSTLVIICTSGCFSDEFFLLGIMWSLQTQVPHRVPVTVSDGFRFPTESFYTELERSVARLCTATWSSHHDVFQALRAYIASIFKKISIPFNTLADIQTLESQASIIWRRVQGGGTEKDVVQAGDDICAMLARTASSCFDERAVHEV